MTQPAQEPEEKNIWGTEGFEDEFNANLLNIRGSVAMANRGKNTNGSQFLLIRKKRNHLKAGIITQAYTTISVKISLPFAGIWKLPECLPHYR